MTYIVLHCSISSSQQARLRENDLPKDTLYVSWYSKDSQWVTLNHSFSSYYTSLNQWQVGGKSHFKRSGWIQILQHFTAVDGYR